MQERRFPHNDKTSIRATADERAAWLPGDDIMRRVRERVTYAVSIAAPPGAVFPWLAQMGCRRAGWYSYDRLDNGGVPSARAILPEFQQPQVGDFFPAAPEDPPGVGFELVDFVPVRHLVLATFSEFPSFRPVQNEDYDGGYLRTTWSFVLRDESPGGTRLIVRNNVDFRPVWLALPANLLGRPLHYVMQRRQLLNLKARAEGRVGVPEKS